MLTVLETLSPAERAAFVLREVFGTPYDEIAAALDKSPSAVRQIAHRAREHVAARQPRMEVSPTERHAVVERFLAAIHTGDVQGLLDVLAPDVVVIADGGGRAPAVEQPVFGAHRVARLLGSFARAAPGARGETTWLNGAPAVRIHLDGTLHAAVSLVVDDGRITRIYAITNPQKLGRLGEPAPIAR